MGRGFSLIGIEAIQQWMNGQDIEAVDRFPRITMCKFIIRTLGDNIQPYDVQCLLPINIYNEKVRIFPIELWISLCVVDLLIYLVLVGIRCNCIDLWSD